MEVIDFSGIDLDGNNLPVSVFRAGKYQVQAGNGVLILSKETTEDPALGDLIGQFHSGYLEILDANITVNIYAARGPQNGVYAAIWFKQEDDKLKGAVLIDAWGTPIEKESIKWFFDSLNEMKDEEFPIEVPGMTHKAHATFKVFKLGFIPDAFRDIKWED